MKSLQTKNRWNIFRPSFTESLDIRWHRALVVQSFPLQPYNELRELRTR